MRRDIQLTIPAPCRESWEAMRPEEGGRWCASCSKTVVDLSAMSDKEVIAYLSRAGQQICGRLAPEQLDRGLPAVVVTGYSNDRLYGSIGSLAYVRVQVDSPWKWATDTLRAIGVLPKKELKVYPNPVRKGSAVSLTWQETEPGQYEVTLFNASGTPVQRRVLEVNGKEQVDLLEVPDWLAAGVYFLRAARAGESRPVTRKIVVL